MLSFVSIGFIVDEVEGKWSIIQSDEIGMESVKWTVSNANVATVAAYLESLSAPVSKKKRPQGRSEEEIFAMCLEKQISG